MMSATEEMLEQHLHQRDQMEIPLDLEVTAGTQFVTLAEGLLECPSLLE